MRNQSHRRQTPPTRWCLFREAATCPPHRINPACVCGVQPGVARAARGPTCSPSQPVLVYHHLMTPLPGCVYYYLPKFAQPQKGERKKLCRNNCFHLSVASREGSEKLVESLDDHCYGSFRTRSVFRHAYNSRPLHRWLFAEDATTALRLMLWLLHGVDLSKQWSIIHGMCIFGKSFGKKKNVYGKKRRYQSVIFLLFP